MEDWLFSIRLKYMIKYCRARDMFPKAYTYVVFHMSCNCLKFDTKWYKQNLNFPTQLIKLNCV